MINALITWSLQNRFLVVCATLCACAFGFKAVRETPVDAIPDLSENQVIVFADWPGRSPQEIEDQVTQPLSTGLQGMAGVQSVRATSMFGASLLTVVFADEVSSAAARQSILELQLKRLVQRVGCLRPRNRERQHAVIQRTFDFHVDPALQHLANWLIVGFGVMAPSLRCRLAARNDQRVDHPGPPAGRQDA